ncbi:YczE/YyaS/YitT family protein [Brotaphodocola sp.]|uniref:YczE/YyaS/YitT family protein n=1 Tax=Brotaphodocola sp. TaxID=3073577 RepID=UPI003D7EE60F
MRNSFPFRRILWVIIGNLIIGVGCALFRLANLGTDPFSCMNLGVSSHLPISYGTYQMLWNFVFFIPMLIWYREGIQFGSFVNMIGVAYMSDFIVWLCGHVGIGVEQMQSLIGIRLGIMVIALLFYCVGVAIYVECAIGVAPYDALGQMIEIWTRGRVKFSIARVLLDVVSVAIGFATGSVIGIATLATACMTGPLVTWFRRNLASRMIA